MGSLHVKYMGEFAPHKYFSAVNNDLLSIAILLTVWLIKRIPISIGYDICLSWHDCCKGKGTLNKWFGVSHVKWQFKCGKPREKSESDEGAPATSNKLFYFLKLLSNADSHRWGSELKRLLSFPGYSLISDHGFFCPQTCAFVNGRRLFTDFHIHWWCRKAKNLSKQNGH